MVRIIPGRNRMIKKLFTFLILMITTAGFAQEASFAMNSDMSQQLQDRISIAVSSPDYPITPGDLYQLTFLTSGGVQNVPIIVPADYQVPLSNLGSINARGLTFPQLKDEMYELVQNSYPLSAPKLVIQSVGTFEVYLTGAVKNSGYVPSWGMGRISDVIKEYKTSFASIRDVQITNDIGQTSTYDLFQATRKGNISQNPFVRPGDRIHLNRATTTVSLDGAVYRPETYQLLPGETLLDLINDYGEGALDNADTSRIQLISSTGVRGVGSKREVSLEEAPSIKINNLDKVTIPTVQDLLPVVFFEGALSVADETNIDLSTSKRIPYNFYPGETIADAVRKLRDQFTQVSNLQEAYIIRGQETIAIDLSRFLYEKDFNDDLQLQPNDTVVIPFRQFFVTVSGAVPAPGRYPYVPDRSWKYYVNLAGGIDPVKNSLDAFKVYDMGDNRIKDVTHIPPEAKIEVATNSFLFYFNQYAPVITTILGVLSTSISVMAATGVIN